MHTDRVPWEELDKICSLVDAGVLKLPLDQQIAITLLERAGLVDSQYYRSCNPDVVAAGYGPAWHYLEFGWKEGRNPNAWFDTRQYLNSHTDIEANLNPLLHFIFYGYRKGCGTGRGISRMSDGIVAAIAPEPTQYATIRHCLKSLQSQCPAPARLVVYLDRDNCLERQLCFNFIDLIDMGVDVHWLADGHLGAAAALDEYPHAPVVLCDASQIYPPGFMSGLFAGHLLFPNDILCRRAEQIFIREENQVSQEDNNREDSRMVVAPDINLGILIPPGCITGAMLLTGECSEIPDLRARIGIVAAKANIGIRVLEEPAMEQAFGLDFRPAS